MEVEVRAEFRTSLAVRWVALMRLCVPILGHELAYMLAEKGVRRLMRFRVAVGDEPFPRKWERL